MKNHRQDANKNEFASFTNLKSLFFKGILSLGQSHGFFYKNKNPIILQDYKGLFNLHTKIQYINKTFGYNGSKFRI
jgi:hypothetical protein